MKSASRWFHCTYIQDERSTEHKNEISSLFGWEVPTLEVVPSILDKPV
jgi:hypothetical protein